MISEERVKELYHLAAFDEYENKKYYQAGEYTMWDYVGKEIVKSFFSGTIAFILLIVFWGLGDGSIAWILRRSSRNLLLHMPDL